MDSRQGRESARTRGCQGTSPQPSWTPHTDTRRLTLWLSGSTVCPCVHSRPFLTSGFLLGHHWSFVLHHLPVGPSFSGGQIFLCPKGHGCASGVQACFASNVHGDTKPLLVLSLCFPFYSPSPKVSWVNVNSLAPVFLADPPAVGPPCPTILTSRPIFQSSNPPPASAPSPHHGLESDLEIPC